MGQVRAGRGVCQLEGCVAGCVSGCVAGCVEGCGGCCTAATTVLARHAQPPKACNRPTARRTRAGVTAATPAPLLRCDSSTRRHGTVALPKAWAAPRACAWPPDRRQQRPGPYDTHAAAALRGQANSPGLQQVPGLRCGSPSSNQQQRHALQAHHPGCAAVRRRCSLRHPRAAVRQPCCSLRRALLLQLHQRPCARSGAALMMK